jgi:hypothetical protein
MTHGAPMWFPSTDSESTAITRLQRVQNDSMQPIRGNHKMAPVDHLLAEYKLLPIKEHLGLLCKQFLASASCESHPSHSVIKQLTRACKGRKR